MTKLLKKKKNSQIPGMNQSKENWQKIEMASRFEGGKKMLNGCHEFIY